MAKAQHAWSACILGVALALCGPDCWAQLRPQSHGFDPSPLQSSLPTDAPSAETVSAAARGPEAWKLGPFPDSPGLTAVADWLKPASERRDSETHLLVIEAKGFREASGHCATGEDINRVIATYRDDFNLRVVMLIQDCIVRGAIVLPAWKDKTISPAIQSVVPRWDSRQDMRWLSADENIDSLPAPYYATIEISGSKLKPSRTTALALSAEGPVTVEQLLINDTEIDGNVSLKDTAILRMLELGSSRVLGRFVSAPRQFRGTEFRVKESQLRDGLSIDGGEFLSLSIRETQMQGRFA